MTGRRAGAAQRGGAAAGRPGARRGAGTVPRGPRGRVRSPANRRRETAPAPETGARAGPADARRRYFVGAVERALGILESVDGSARGTGVTELSRRLGLGKSTVHRLCRTLEHRGYLVRDPGTGRYRLSLRVFQIGSAALSALDLPTRAMPALEALGAAVQETVHLAVLEGHEIVFIAKVESPRPLALYSRVGRRSPAHCTALGKVLLAFGGPAARAGGPLRRYTAGTITAPPALERSLEDVRRRGYAVDDQEFEEGIRCVAAPVRDHSGTVVAAVSISAPAGRLPRARIASLAAQVAAAAGRISADLGHAAAGAAGGAGDA